MTGGLGSDPCASGTGGRTGADAICSAEYNDDVDEDDRTRISEERGGAELHRALLADKYLIATGFRYSNKAKREIHALTGKPRLPIAIVIFLRDLDV